MFVHLVVISLVERIIGADVPDLDVVAVADQAIPVWKKGKRNSINHGAKNRAINRRHCWIVRAAVTSQRGACFEISERVFCSVRLDVAAGRDAEKFFFFLSFLEGREEGAGNGLQ